MTVFDRNLPDSGDGDKDEDEDEDKDKDEDEDEIPNYAVLLTASVQRVGVSRMRDFCVMLRTKSMLVV